MQLLRWLKCWFSCPDPTDPVARHDHWTTATGRVRKLPTGAIYDWGTAITGYGMRMLERLPTSTDPTDEIHEIRTVGISLVALADELERRLTIKDPHG
ncbi:hypothetical protein ABZ543_13050 [Streptomyces roseifaciens]